MIVRLEESSRTRPKVPNPMANVSSAWSIPGLDLVTRPVPNFCLSAKNLMSIQGFLFRSSVFDYLFHGLYGLARDSCKQG